MFAKCILTIAVLIAAAGSSATAAAAATATNPQGNTSREIVGVVPAGSPETHLHVPPPPHRLGCFRTTGDVWRTVPCDTQAFIKQHVPHPEVLSGVSGGVKVIRGKRHRSGPIDVSVISAQVVRGQFTGEYDTVYGPYAASLQNNEFFVGNNGVEDGVQFTDQTISGENNVCVWQIDIPAQAYFPECNSILGGESILKVEGVSFAGILTVAAASTGGTAVAVNVPDIYGLGVGNRWNNSSGGVLGYGEGSHAVYENTEMEMALEASSCLDDAGFIGYSVFCLKPKLKPAAYVSYSPGPSTNNYKTVETNNLTPVIGNPPGHLPTPLTYFFGGYTAQINYTATSTGKCWTGAPPYCF